MRGHRRQDTHPPGKRQRQSDKRQGAQKRGVTKRDHKYETQAGGREAENRVRIRTSESPSPPTARGQGWRINLYSWIPKVLPALRTGGKRFPTPHPHRAQAISGLESVAHASWGPQNVTPPSALLRVRGPFQR